MKTQINAQFTLANKQFSIANAHTNERFAQAARNNAPCSQAAAGNNDKFASKNLQFVNMHVYA